MVSTEIIGFIVAGSLLGLILIVALIYVLKKKSAGGTYYGIETMVGKTVVITGANTGIGKETVKDLAMRGARIIMGCRNTDKGNEAVQEVISLTKNTNIENRKLDLSSLASVRAFAESILATEPRIDVLINNAGVMMCPRSLTKDGLETQIGVNHFGHFLLTSLLLDRLKESAPSRIIIVSSIAHGWTNEIKFDDLNSERSYSKIRAYGQSKLANMLHMLELSKRLQGTGVTVNSLHPGVVKTELTRHNSACERALTLPATFFFKERKQGAQTTLRLAIDPELENVTGRYFKDCKVARETAAARNADTAKRLWDVSEEITSKA